METCPFNSNNGTPSTCNNTCALKLNGGCAFVVIAQMLEKIKDASNSTTNELESLNFKIKTE